MKIFKIVLVSLLLTFVVGCMESLQPAKKEPVIENPFMTQKDLATLIAMKLDVAKLMASPLRKQVELPPHFPSVESWINQTKEAAHIRASSDRFAITNFIYLNLSGTNFSTNNIWDPEKAVTRGEFAEMLLDIAMRLKGSTSLKDEFKGQRSPYGDVTEDDSCFHAVMAVSSRGLMTAYDRKKGEFAPELTIKRETALTAFGQLDKLL